MIIYLLEATYEKLPIRSYLGEVFSPGANINC